MEEKNNEMIELVETNEPEVVDVEVEESGMSTGVAMLIGSGLTLAVMAGVKKGREWWKKHKAKRAEIEAEAEVIGNADDDSETASEAPEEKEQ